MKKYLSMGLLAISCLGFGWYLLLTAPKASAQRTPELVWDWEEYCDDENYLASGLSLLGEEQGDELAGLLDLQLDEPLLPPSKNPYVAILKDQSLHEIFKPHRVSSQEVAALTAALSPHLRARDIAVGDYYKFNLAPGDHHNQIIKSFEIRKPDPNRLPITYLATRENLSSAKAIFVVKVSSPEIIEKTRLIEIKVQDTLFGSFSGLPFGNELMQKFMTVFAWRMRMPEQVAKNDKINILVTENFADNKFLGYGNLQAIIYENTQKTTQAFYFRSQDTKISGYYDESGHSLEKELLISPVKNTVATSMQRLRFHPVIKSRIKHNGTDFRGAIGTDFFAIGDGEIIEKRFDKNVGHMMRIRHKYGIHSEYFHANSLVEKLVVGSRVKRGQKIGEIGRTGLLCTGPHLHLGLYKLDGDKRKYLELTSLRNQLADQPKLSGNYLAEFNTITKKTLVQMQPKRPQMPIANKFKNSGEISKN